MKYRSIKPSLGNTCRSCLNDSFKIDLKPSDCYYMIYPQRCSNCGEIKNIVSRIRWKKRLMLLFK